MTNEKPVTFVLTYIRSDEKEADTVEDAFVRVAVYPFKTDLLLVDRGFYNEQVIRPARELAMPIIPAKMSR